MDTMIGGILLLAANIAIGLGLITLGLTSSSPVWGPIFFWIGVLGANAGFAAIMVWVSLRMER